MLGLARFLYPLLLAAGLREWWCLTTLPESELGPHHTFLFETFHLDLVFLSVCLFHSASRRQDLAAEVGPCSLLAICVADDACALIQSLLSWRLSL